jgi:hypothetical protein
MYTTSSLLIQEFENDIALTFMLDDESIEEVFYIIRDTKYIHNPFIESFSESIEDNPILSISFKNLDKLIIRSNYKSIIESYIDNFLIQGEPITLSYAAILYFITIVKLWMYLYKDNITYIEEKYTEIIFLQRYYSEKLLSFINTYGIYRYIILTLHYSTTHSLQHTLSKIVAKETLIEESV